MANGRNKFKFCFLIKAFSSFRASIKPETNNSRYQHPYNLTIYSNFLLLLHFRPPRCARKKQNKNRKKLEIFIDNTKINVPFYGFSHSALTSRLCCCCGKDVLCSVNGRQLAVTHIY